MKFTEITQSGPSDVFTFSNRGDTLKGEYLGGKTITRKDGSTSRLYSLQTEEGKKSFWGCYQLNETLPGVPVGTYLMIAYGGKNKLPSGKTMHSFSISEGVADSEEQEAV